MSALPNMLRYSQDSEPGIIRHKCGEDYIYRNSNGELIRNKAILSRIEGLGLPPAYRDVWICSDEFGHLQATGRDEAGRKQYRYHAQWRAFQDRKKFDSLTDFGAALPALRRKIQRDLRRQDNSRAYVCAALARLIDSAALRIGHARNAAIGASTLKGQHIKFEGNTLRLDYKAKGGKRVRKIVRDKSLSHALQRIDDLPGRTVFQFINNAGDLSSIDSAHVNAYIGPNFTAKTFRTWHGSIAAFKVAAETTKTPTIKSMCEAAAKQLHNTPSICRNSYIHPKIISLSEHNNAREFEGEMKRGLRKEERNMLAFLKG